MRGNDKGGLGAAEIERLINSMLNGKLGDILARLDELEKLKAKFKKL